MKYIKWDDIEYKDEAYITDDDYMLDSGEFKVKEYADCYDYGANYGTMYTDKLGRGQTRRDKYGTY